MNMVFEDGNRIVQAVLDDDDAACSKQVNQAERKLHLVVEISSQILGAESVR
jgi:hypothetical protein